MRRCRMGMHLMPIILIVTGPPGTNYAVMRKAFEEGWGAVIAKTVSLDSSKVFTHLAHSGQQPINLRRKGLI